MHVLLHLMPVLPAIAFGIAWLLRKDLFGD